MPTPQTEDFVQYALPEARPWTTKTILAVLFGLLVVPGGCLLGVAIQITLALLAENGVRIPSWVPALPVTILVFINPWIGLLLSAIAIKSPGPKFKGLQRVLLWLSFSISALFACLCLWTCIGSTVRSWL